MRKVVVKKSRRKDRPLDSHTPTDVGHNAFFLFSERSSVYHIKDKRFFWCLGVSDEFLVQSENHRELNTKGQSAYKLSGGSKQVKVWQRRRDGKHFAAGRIKQRRDGSWPFEATEEQLKLTQQAYRMLGQEMFWIERGSKKIILTEYIGTPGQNIDLFQLIHTAETRDRFPLSREEKLTLIKNLLKRELIPLWEAGLVHRDIKPENIVYDPVNNQLRLIDLGYVIKTQIGVMKNNHHTPQYRYRSIGGSTSYFLQDDIHAGVDQFALSLVLGDWLQEDFEFKSVEYQTGKNYFETQPFPDCDPEAKKLYQQLRASAGAVSRMGRRVTAQAMIQELKIVTRSATTSIVSPNMSVESVSPTRSNSSPQLFKKPVGPKPSPPSVGDVVGFTNNPLRVVGP